MGNVPPQATDRRYEDLKRSRVYSSAVFSYSSGWTTQDKYVTKDFVGQSVGICLEVLRIGLHVLTKRPQTDYVIKCFPPRSINFPTEGFPLLKALGATVFLIISPPTFQTSPD